MKPSETIPCYFIIMEEALKLADEKSRQLILRDEKILEELKNLHIENLLKYVDRKLKKLNIKKIHSHMIKNTEKGYARRLILMRIPLESPWTLRLFHKLHWYFGSSDIAEICNLLESPELLAKITSLLKYNDIHIETKHNKYYNEIWLFVGWNISY